MRVCLVSSAYRPYISGVGEHVYHLAQQLKYLGHEVHILSTNYHLDCKEDSGSLTRLGRGLRIRFAQGEFTLPVAFRLAENVKSFFRQHDFDVIHCHGIFPPELAYWAARYTDSPFVITFHAVTPRLPRYIGKTFQRLFHCVVKKNRAKIAVSHVCKRWAETFFPGDFYIIPNGVDTNKFRPNVPPAVTNSTPNILFVGRLEKRKGLEILLKVLGIVKKEIPDLKLIVVGFGPLEKYYSNLAYKLGLNDCINFVGPVTNDQLAAYYTSATVYVAPTIKPEAMGIVIIEAMSCARPIIASNITGYNEIITNGINGILIPPGDYRALAQAIVAVINSKDYQEYLGRNARIRAEEFDWKRIGKRIEAVYREVLE